MYENKNMKLRWCRVIGIFWLAVSMTVFGFGQSPAFSEKELLNKAAARSGRSLADLRIDPDDLEFYGYGRYRLKIFSKLIEDPLEAAPITRILCRTLLNNADSLWTIAFTPWARIDEGVRRGLIERPEKILLDLLEKKPDVRRVLTGEFGLDSNLVQLMPDSLVIGLVLIMWEIQNSCDWIKAATARITEQDIDTIMMGLTTEGENGLSNRRLESLIDAVDFKGLAAGAMDLGYVLQAATGIMKNIKIDKPVRCSSRLGRIAIGTTGHETYDDGFYLLIIDFGGDDEYVSCGVSGKNNPVSVLIDYDGDDIYRGHIGPGTGICGYGIVIDLNGNDQYRAEKIGLGTGVFGEGIIFDNGGNDTYDADVYGEGAGLFGAGIISDLSGDDRYTAFECSQGFGFVKGCGILVDKDGNDTYIARDDTVKYASSQSSEHNASLSQGVGFGVRADYTDGHSLAGGVGMLIDGKGADQYSCGVFGQGCGYWFGTGILVDYEGNDEYNGVWYTQGAGAHFAIGVLLDSTGNDKYVSTMNMAQGAGHDFTLGLLVDYSGDDAYDAPNLSLGSGNANGMGLFMDMTGNDSYITHGGITLGGASTASRGGLRDMMKTLGIFIDGKGHDSYKEPSTRDHKYWRQKPPLEPPLETEWCIGVDL
ncbi:MAG TPA: hypothetical protein VF399_00210 [bacterium]